MTSALRSAMRKAFFSNSMPARKVLVIGIAFLSVVFDCSAGKAVAETIVVNTAATVLQLKGARPDRPKAKLFLYTTMATWCVACKTELPQFAYLHSIFKPEEIEIYGLPYDEKDEAVQLKSWAETNVPPYKLLHALTKNEIAAVKRVVLRTLKIDAVPTSIVTDHSGRVLRVRWGPPSVSELRELLRLQAG